MAEPKLTKLELQIMETLWTRGEASIREIQEAFPEKHRPAYTTIQTTVYRLEGKNALRRVKKVGNFHIFAAAISRDAAQRRLVDDQIGGGLQTASRCRFHSATCSRVLMRNRPMCSRVRNWLADTLP